MATLTLLGQGAAVLQGTRTLQVGANESVFQSFTSPTYIGEKTIHVVDTAASQTYAAFRVPTNDIAPADMASRGEHLFGAVRVNGPLATPWVGQDLVPTQFGIRINGTAAWEEPANWSIDRWGVSYLDQENTAWISTNASQIDRTLSIYDQFGTPASSVPLWGNWYVVQEDPISYTITPAISAPIKTIELTGSLSATAALSGVRTISAALTGAATTSTALTGTRTAAATMTGVQTTTATLTGDAGKAE